MYLEEMADEASMNADTVVPFPHELSMALTQELATTFGADTLVLFTPGSGFGARAAVALGKRAVVFCATPTYKAWLQDNLMEFVKALRITTRATSTT